MPQDIVIRVSIFDPRYPVEACGEVDVQVALLEHDSIQDKAKFLVQESVPAVEAAVLKYMELRASTAA